MIFEKLEVRKGQMIRKQITIIAMVMCFILGSSMTAFMDNNLTGC